MKFNLTLLLFLVSFTASAQQKTISMNDAFMNSALMPQNLKYLQWLTDGVHYSYVGKKNAEECLIVSSAKSKNDTVLYAAALNPGVKTLPIFSWLTNEELLFNDGATYKALNYKSKITSTKLVIKDNAANQEWNADKSTMAYTVDNNLYYSNSEKSVPITNETNKDIVNGQAVHRNEFNIMKGIFWSPSNDKIAFYRMDQTMVTDYPLVDISSTPAKLNSIKYPMAGQSSHEVSVGVYSVRAAKTIFLKIAGPKDQYLTNIAWSKDGKSIYVAVVSRSYQEMNLNQYDANTGDFIKTLFTEKDEKYVEPNEPMIFLSNGNFIWHSERDGYRHLYLYSKEGKLIKQITSGNWVVVDFLGLDAKEKTAYYTSTENSPINRDLFSVDLKTNKRTRLTSEQGTHAVTLNAQATSFIDNYSNTETPRVIQLISTKGVKEKSLLVSTNPLKDYSLGEMNISSIKAADGKTDLFTRIFKPTNFDATKKYPVVIYVYAGPHVQLISNSWLGGANLWFQVMAEKGFIVYTVDSRGTMFRGRDFEQATHRNLGKVELADQLKGVDYLKSLSYVDTNRIGVHGWSFGGFMTTSMMTKANKVFKVGVAGGPVIDWSMYEIMYTERYMDTPNENPEGYKESNLMNFADQLKGRLLMIHGTVDDVVVWQNSQAFVKKCVDKGVLLDYFVYPGHPHNVKGKDRVHLYNTVTRYFEDHL
jgi:dipeptidyl-peptidase-4